MDTPSADISQFINRVGSSSTFINEAGEAGKQNRFAENFDTFLQLLTTQLTNQDPLSPLDTHQFTNQLVQFASVEQQIEQSGNIRQLVDMMRTTEATSAIAYIGKNVYYQGDKFELPEEGGVALHYELPDDITNARLRIINGEGETVDRRVLTVEAGRQTITWDGTGKTDDETDITRQEAGQYRVMIDVDPIEGLEDEVGVAVYYSPARVIGVREDAIDGLVLGLSTDEETAISRILSVSEGT